MTIAFLLIGFAIQATGQKKQVIGYYPSWKWNAAENAMTPAQIPFKKLTMINYAFFFPREDGTLAGRDTVGDDLILRGVRDPASGGYVAGTSLVERAHLHNVRVLLSVGGWEDSNNFPAVAASPDRRSSFAHSCIEQILRYGFDGIDIDWEYPGYSEHRGSPTDRSNCTMLLQELRDSLSAYGERAGAHLLLTAALPASEALLAGFELDKLVPLLDMFNIMTYDLSGTWDPVSGHNAPLFAPRGDDTLRNLDAAFRLFVGTFNVPAEKINLGVPFYGHSFARCTSLYAPHAGADTVHFSSHGLFYYDIVPVLSKFNRVWDDRAKVPFLVNPDWNVLISYDDEESVRYKARYAIDQHAGGLIIWEITGDYLQDGRTPLLDTIFRMMRSPGSED